MPIFQPLSDRKFWVPHLEPPLSITKSRPPPLNDITKILKSFCLSIIDKKIEVIFSLNRLKRQKKNIFLENFDGFSLDLFDNIFIIYP